jgi:aryl-alcohol dehydrogenase-like predicted oxidoreductase
VLSGKYNAEVKPEQGRALEGAATVERNLRIAGLVVEIAKELGCTPSQVAIAWMCSRPGVIVPLIGARNLKQLEDNLGALQVNLDQTQLDRLEAASVIDLGFPHDFLAAENIRDIVYGGTADRIDNHRMR